jgi:hypothetical protein
MADQTIQSFSILAQDGISEILLLAPQLFGKLRVDIRGGGQLTCRLRGLLLARRGDRTDQQSEREGHLKHPHLFQVSSRTINTRTALARGSRHERR